MPDSPLACDHASVPGEKATWRGSPESREYLEAFLEHCRRADLPGKERLLQLLEQTLAGEPYVDASDQPPPPPPMPEVRHNGHATKRRD
jgi:hypothetical protein